MLHFLSRPLSRRHMDTHHTVYCPRTHRHKPQIYTTLIHSILYTCPRSCEVISSHADTLSRDTFSKAWIRHTQTHAYKYMYMYTCKHSRGFYSSSNHLKWEKRGLTRAVMFLCHVVKISICHTEGLLAGIKGCFIWSSHLKSFRVAFLIIRNTLIRYKCSTYTHTVHCHWALLIDL